MRDIYTQTTNIVFIYTHKLYICVHICSISQNIYNKYKNYSLYINYKYKNHIHIYYIYILYYIIYHIYYVFIYTQFIKEL